MQAIVLNGAKIGKRCIIGAGALVTSHMEIPDESLVMGAPAKIIRRVRPEEIAKIIQGAKTYCERAAYYALNLEETKT